MVLFNLVSLVVSFFFKYMVCSELYIIKYNLFKEPSLTVQRSPVLAELQSWSSVCYCSEPLHLSGAGSFAGLQAGCVGLSIQSLTYFRVGWRKSGISVKRRG